MSFYKIRIDMQCFSNLFPLHALKQNLKFNCIKKIF